MVATDRQLEVGARLRDIRQQQGMTLQQVEAASGGTWKAVVVGSYERGDRAVSVPRLAALAAFYRVPVAELLPAPAIRPARSVGRPRVVIDLTRLALDAPGGDASAGGPSGGAAAGDPTLTPLSRFVRTVQVQRGDYNGRMLSLRRGDLQALSMILDRGADELVADLGRRGLLLGTVRS